MAAPHVSGVIAAFLSVRREFIGQAGEGEGDLPVDGHRPEARPPLPGPRPGRPDAGHPVRLDAQEADAMQRAVRVSATSRCSSTKDGAVARPGRGRGAAADCVGQGGDGHRPARDRAWLEQRHGRGARALQAASSRSVRRCSTAAGSRRSPGAAFAVLGVLWPSKKFAEEDLIPSGAASGRLAGADAAVIETARRPEGRLRPTRRRRRARARPSAGPRARGQPGGARESSPT